MNFTQVDWGVLRGAIIFMAVVLVACGGLIYAGNEFSKQAVNEFTRERSKLLRVRGEYQTIDDEKTLIETYLPQFEALEQRGIIGEEHRLSWVEALRDSARRMKLPSLRYELRPQQEYAAEFPLGKGAFKVYSSDMTLDVGLLHEGDLAALFKELSKNATGLFTVSKCRLRGSGASVIMEPTAKNVNARCDLRWFTIGPPEDDSA